MTKPKILIIEDSPTFAEYLSEVINKENYAATVAITGKSGLQYLKESDYNLLLLDMELPDCSGIDIIKDIRLHHNQIQLPVIFISGTTDEHKIIEALEFGGNDFISKPFSEITLKIKVKNFLQLQYYGLQLSTNLKIQEDQNHQLQKYADELSQINKDKEMFISILAHDLKNPFNTLLGFSNLLLKNLHKYNMSKIEEQIEVIYKTSDQTYHLLEELLLWSQSSAGRLPFKPEKIEFISTCKQIVDELRNQAEVKNITIELFDCEKTFIQADLNMFRTIVRNLLSNAIKYTNIGGNISIYTSEGGPESIIFVEDNGVGVDLEQESKLFDSSTLHTTAGTEDEKGTGLGLKLCKSFVEKHNGKIWVESLLGKGSKFVFTMPVNNT